MKRHRTRKLPPPWLKHSWRPTIPSMRPHLYLGGGFVVHYKGWSGYFETEIEARAKAINMVGQPDFNFKEYRLDGSVVTWKVDQQDYGIRRMDSRRPFAPYIQVPAPSDPSPFMEALKML